MTKFDELVDIITHNKNENKKVQSNYQADDLEVAGSESTKNPLISFGDSETDPGLSGQLHRSPKLKPNDGFVQSTTQPTYTS